jgi:hypothetical protein
MPVLPTDACHEVLCYLRRLRRNGKIFPQRKNQTGQSVRQTYDNIENIKDEAFKYFGLKNDKPVIFWSLEAPLGREYN